MKMLALSALILISTATVTAQQAPARSYGQGPLPALQLTSTHSNGGTVGYGYHAGSADCGTYNGQPMEAYARRDPRVPEMPGNTDRDATLWVVARAYDCWASAGLVPADAVGSWVLAERYAFAYVELCGESVRPLGLPDSRPSRCSSAPNLNL